MIRFASLGSGSRGNALLVEAGGTRVLIDCGFGLRDTIMRLGRLNTIAEGLDAIIVTHEHGDHIGGVGRLAARFGIPVYLTRGTLGDRPDMAMLPELRIISDGGAFEIDALQVLPFAIPHDSREPVQYVLSDGVRRLGVLTDAGHAPADVLALVSDLDALVLECNHDEDMLRDGPYPAFLKARVGGTHGHLSNRQAASILKHIDCGRLRHIVAAHLSEKNNTPDLARAALAAALGCNESWVGVASQSAGFGWREI